MNLERNLQEVYAEGGSYKKNYSSVTDIKYGATKALSVNLHDDYLLLAVWNKHLIK